MAMEKYGLRLLSRLLHVLVLNLLSNTLLIPYGYPIVCTDILQVNLLTMSLNLRSLSVDIESVFVCFIVDHGSSFYICISCKLKFTSICIDKK